jgi:hypothetical protein
MFQNLWTLLDKDDLIGFVVWDFNQKELIEQEGIIDFSQRWDVGAKGDWEVCGSFYLDGKEPGPDHSGLIDVHLEEEEGKRGQ